MTDTDERMIREIARLCSLPESRVERTVTLLQGGATIPFITRYRKEATGGLDEVQVGAVRDQLERLNALEACKRTVRSAIEAAGKMTGALSAQLDDCWERRQIGRPLSALQAQAAYPGRGGPRKRVGAVGCAADASGRQPARAAGRPFRPGRGRRPGTSARRSLRHRGRVGRGKRRPGSTDCP